VAKFHPQKTLGSLSLTQKKKSKKLVANKKGQVAEWSPVFGFCLPILLLGGQNQPNPAFTSQSVLDLEYSCAAQQKGVPTPCEARQGG